jgi:hypothetical protein
MDRDPFQFIMEQRDIEVLKYRKEMAKLEREEKKKAKKFGTE